MPLWCWLLVFISSGVRAQSVTFSVVDARSRALGGTGLTDEGVFGLWTNPAALAAGAGVAGAASVERRFGLGELSLASAGIVLPGDFGVRMTNFSPPAYSETAVALAYGRTLSPSLSVGAEAGTQFIAVRGAEGRVAVMAGVGGTYRLARTLRLGLSYRQLGVGAADRSLALGGAYLPNERLRLLAEYHWRSGGGGGPRLGLEYLPVARLALRLGLGGAAATELAFGVAYRVLERVNVSITAPYHERLGVSPTFGIVVLPTAATTDE